VETRSRISISKNIEALLKNTINTTSVARLSFIWSYVILRGPMGSYGGLFLQKWSREEQFLFGKKKLLLNCTNYEKISFEKKITFSLEFHGKILWNFLEYFTPLMFLFNPGGPMCYLRCSFELYVVLCGPMWSYGFLWGF